MKLFNTPLVVLLCTCTVWANAPILVLPSQAAYAVFEAEVATMHRIFDGSRRYCISIGGSDPSDHLLSRLRLLYQPLSPASNCADVLDANIDIRLVEAIDDGLIKVSFNCSPGCDYETTFTLELAAGNWLIQSARHRM